jgi:hypothetical protein
LSMDGGELGGLVEAHRHTEMAPLDGTVNLTAKSWVFCHFSCCKGGENLVLRMFIIQCFDSPQQFFHSYANSRQAVCMQRGVGHACMTIKLIMPSKQIVKYKKLDH